MEETDNMGEDFEKELDGVKREIENETEKNVLGEKVTKLEGEIEEAEDRSRDKEDQVFVDSFERISLKKNPTVKETCKAYRKSIDAIERFSPDSIGWNMIIQALGISYPYSTADKIKLLAQIVLTFEGR